MSISTELDSEISTGWQGSLNLVFAHRHGGTQLIENRVKAPLKVQRSLYPEGKEVCHTIILHTAGGIVGGDRLAYDFHLQPDTQALITTPAATKIYRSNGQSARQAIQIQIDAGATLEWLPQETIVFNGAIYRQDLQVELAPDASWLGWEITRFGRSARGERFLQGEWRSHTEVWQQGKPLWIDRQWLPAGEEIVNSPHGLGGQAIVGSLAWVGQAVTPETVDRVRQLWLHPQELGEIGVTRLISGILCRYRGSNSAAARKWFISAWDLLRRSHLNRSSCIPRVWQI
ncbi:MAG: urease accessory protein UreD [Cyanosarcina radialis HA8281-LM2]|jgi:urease accessory protein|nr:urease accessory protein UreD [Cyanosarcina radialis HA8281-LM2]